MISLSTPVALGLAGYLLFWAIGNSGADTSVFFSLPSLAIVLGGTFCATIVSYDVKSFMKSLAFIFRSFGRNSYSESELKKSVDYLVSISKDVRSNKVSTIDEDAPKSLKRDPLFVKGVELLQTKAKEAEIKAVLGNINDATWQGYTKHSTMLNRMGTYAPGFGVVGTIIGLIAMMQNMSDDAGSMEAMGQAMAVAFITTLYGVVIANLVFKPAAAAITVLQENAHYRGQVLLQAFCGLSNKVDEDSLQEQLGVLINPKAKAKMVEEFA